MHRTPPLLVCEELSSTEISPLARPGFKAGTVGRVHWGVSGYACVTGAELPRDGTYCTHIH